MRTVSDVRAEKARNSGDLAAWIRDKKNIREEKARRAFLRENPDVGTLNRDGKVIFYRFPVGGAYTEFTPNFSLL